MQQHFLSIDLAKVQAIVYHLPEGGEVTLPVQPFLDIFLEQRAGRFCDTTEANGLLHFFPLGNA